MTLPPFEDDVLPPGDYALSLQDLRQSYLVNGEGVDSENWDTMWRAKLVTNLSILARQLWQVGVDNIFVDGSFTENKDHPNDIDGYFEVDLRLFASGLLQHQLNQIDPYRAWTWNHAHRRPDPDSTKWQLPMWHQYRVELYPHFPGLKSGIPDEFGHELEFPAAFRKSRIDHRPKGIIRIVR